jgi:hypothetical protein
LSQSLQTKVQWEEAQYQNLLEVDFSKKDIAMLQLDMAHYSRKQLISQTKRSILLLQCQVFL